MSSSPQPVQSFKPISKPDARVLVLGSMPGVASLDEQAYYAHPRNALWPIMIACFTETRIDDVDLATWPYQQRLELLTRNRVALWDVLAECIRPGSLDSAIDQKSVKVNPITEFLDQHNEVERIVFNGKAAHDMFKRHIRKPKDSTWPKYNVDLITMPSTSPAMATLSLPQKHAAWQSVLGSDRP